MTCSISHRDITARAVRIFTQKMRVEQPEMNLLGIVERGFFVKFKHKNTEKAWLEFSEPYYQAVWNAVRELEVKLENGDL